MKFLGAKVGLCAIYIILLMVCTPALTISLSGCAHTQINSWPEAEGPTPNPPMHAEKKPITATLSEGKVHELKLEFEGGMNHDTVRTSVTDDEGQVLSDLRYVWSDEWCVLHIYGPFAFCRTYTVTINAGAQDVGGTVLEDDMALSTTIGANPFDIDRSGSCTADVAFSPVFSESSDALILTGDVMAEAQGLAYVDGSDVEEGSLWYVSGHGSYPYAGGVARIPGLSESRAAGIAKLFRQDEQKPYGDVTTHYTLDLWDTYDPAKIAPATTLLYDVEGSADEELLGPYDAGQLTGHDVSSLLVAGQVSTTGKDLMQHVFLLRAPVAHGSGLSLADTAEVDRFVGLLGTVLLPFTAVGDLDADGYDDLAAINYKNLNGGYRGNWYVWITHGASDPATLFDGLNREKISGTMGREIVDIDGGDMNGDGASDLIVSDVIPKNMGGTTRYVYPKVNIFYGGARDLDGLKMDDRNVMFAIDGNHAYEVSARALGDLNGDGYDDMGIGITRLDDYGRVVFSRIYIIAGSDTLEKGSLLESSLYTAWAAKIVADKYSEVVLKDEFWDPRVGDVDNDGYYDFMIKVPEADGYTAYLFKGGKWINEMEPGKILHPADAAAAWRFISQ